MQRPFPDNPSEIQRLEVVGPKIGADLTNKALERALLCRVADCGLYFRPLRTALDGCRNNGGLLWGGMYLLNFTGLGMGWQVLVALAITLAVCFVLKTQFCPGRGRPAFCMTLL